MSNFDKLTEIFKTFPGIGPRQAKRFAYYLIRSNSKINKELAEAVIKIKQEVKECAFCHKYWSQKVGSLCEICSDASRNKNKMMIVAYDSDIEAVEKSGAYNGLYFVLGGLIPILEENINEHIRLNDFTNSLNTALKQGLNEIIIALSVTAEGDNTAKQIYKLIKNQIELNKNQNGNSEIIITNLGRGVSTGSELEYADGETIKSALDGRKTII